jgi:hypothetical protein
VARNPEDAFFSFYKFLPAYTGLKPDDIDEETFSNAIFAGASHSGQIWDHMLGWWMHRHSKNVLWVFVEDMKDDLQREVIRVAQFMGVDLADEERIHEAIERSGFAQMAKPENAHHFDDHFVSGHHLHFLRHLSPHPPHLPPPPPLTTSTTSNACSSSWPCLLALPASMHMHMHMHELSRWPRVALHADTCVPIRQWNLRTSAAGALLCVTHDGSPQRPDTREQGA